MTDLLALAETAAKAAADADAALKAAMLAERKRLVGTLRERRRALNMTQADVAARCILGRAQIANAEAGEPERGISLEGLISYAHAVGMTVTLTEKSTP